MLGELNHQLIEHEGHRNRMTIPELSTQAEDWTTTWRELNGAFGMRTPTQVPF